MAKLLTTIIIYLFFINHINAQYGNVWAFGYNYGLDFNSGSPQFFDSTSIFYREGAASICDTNGLLLIYTDGNNVWDRNHQIMPNGDSLGDVGTTTQPAIIINLEGTNLFYIFTTEDNTLIHESTLRYSVVDMNLNNGFGDIIQKNTWITSFVTEKIAATRHCNGRDWWVITRSGNSDKFISVLFTSDGIIHPPILSSTGFYEEVYRSALQAGQLKISPNGKLLIISYDGYGCEMLKFDNYTGIVQPFFSDFVFGWKGGYGSAFSSDSKFAYATYQYIDSTTYLDEIPDNDIFYLAIDKYTISDDPIVTKASKIRLAQRDSIAFWSSLQLGPDNKIYARGSIYDTTEIPQWTRDKLFVIVEGIDSVMETNIYFPHQNIVSSLGLPTFPDAIFTNHHVAKLSFNSCSNTDTLLFFDSLLTSTRDYLWDFGDTISGNNNFESIQFPYHFYSQPGTYTVTLTLPSNCNPITIIRQITIPPNSDIPTINFENGILTCSQSEIYQWYLNGSPVSSGNNQNYIPTLNGTYFVETTNNGCTFSSDTIEVLTVSIESISSSNLISYFPNPTNDYIEYNKPNNSPCNFRMYDAVGKLIISQTIQDMNGKIDFKYLTNGVYYIKDDSEKIYKVMILK